MGSMQSARCESLASKVTTLPGGVSAGMTHCIHKFWSTSEAGGNPYLKLIDSVEPAFARGVTSSAVNVSIQWRAQVTAEVEVPVYWQYPNKLPKKNGDYKSSFNRAEWLLPPGYTSSETDEARMVFVHGCNALCSSLGPYYLSLVANLANWTRMPVFAADFATEPLVPWPQNIRNVLHFVSYVLHNGPLPHGQGRRAGSVFLLGDSEGTLLTMQTVISIFDHSLRRRAGYGRSLHAPESWLKGVVLSSPVVDIACSTRSFEYNCYNATAGTGDPDTGNCTDVATPELRLADCRASYLPYFFGLATISGVHTRTQAGEVYLERQDFFEQGGDIAPLRANLTGLPPMLLLAGTRDYFFSDSPALATALCEQGVEVEVYNADGGFHDFIEYAQGCGGDAPVEEALEAYRRIAAFTAARTR